MMFISKKKTSIKQMRSFAFHFGADRYRRYIGRAFLHSIYMLVVHYMITFLREDQWEVL
jgi:hypothetical protein